MSQVYLVVSTFPDLDSAREIGSKLVEEHLAACVTLVPAVESIYRWHGKIERTQETLALLKTSVESRESLEKRLKDLHPYQVPEIVAWRPEAIHSAYENWVLAETANRKMSEPGMNGAL